MKKLFGLLILLTGVLTLAACSTTLENDDLTEQYGYARVEINPTIEFIVDEEGLVASYDLLNEDAEIVAAELELVGLPVEDALELFLEQAVDLGYLEVDAENNITIITNDEETDADVDEETDADVDEETDTDEDADEEGKLNLREKLSERAEGYLEGRGIGVAVKYESLDEELLELAEDYDIGLGRLHMIQRAVELNDELTFEEALELEQREIMEMLRGNHQERMENFRNERRDMMKEVRDNMREQMQDRRSDRFNDDEDLDDNTNDEENTEDNTNDVN